MACIYVPIPSKWIGWLWIASHQWKIVLILVSCDLSFGTGGVKILVLNLVGGVVVAPLNLHCSYTQYNCFLFVKSSEFGNVVLEFVNQILEANCLKCCLHCWLCYFSIITSNIIFLSSILKNMFDVIYLIIIPIQTTRTLIDSSIYVVTYMWVGNSDYYRIYVNTSHIDYHNNNLCTWIY